MIEAIFAGLLIALGGTLYLSIGGTVGAVAFSLGLLTILHFKLYLFTGKAGLLLSYEINPYDLSIIWCGNLSGTALGALIALAAKPGLDATAANIMSTRISNSWIQNIYLGILCGLLMYIAVVSYSTKPWITVMAVAAFILAGFNHCIADMFYMCMACDIIPIGPAALTILCTTVGNIIGCNLIPLYTRLKGR